MSRILRLRRAYSAVVAYGYEGWKASPYLLFMPNSILNWYQTLGRTEGHRSA